MTPTVKPKMVYTSYQLIPLKVRKLSSQSADLEWDWQRTSLLCRISRLGFGVTSHISQA